MEGCQRSYYDLGETGRAYAKLGILSVCGDATVFLTLLTYFYDDTDVNLLMITSESYCCTSHDAAQISKCSNIDARFLMNSFL